MARCCQFCTSGHSSSVPAPKSQGPIGLSSGRPRGGQAAAAVALVPCRRRAFVSLVRRQGQARGSISIRPRPSSVRCTCIGCPAGTGTAAAGERSARPRAPHDDDGGAPRVGAHADASHSEIGSTAPIRQDRIMLAQIHLDWAGCTDLAALPFRHPHDN